MSGSEVQRASAEADCVQNWKAVAGKSYGSWRYLAGNINLFKSDSRAWWGMGRRGMGDPSELAVCPAVLLTHSLTLLTPLGPSAALGTMSSFHVLETFRAALSDKDVSSCGIQGYQMKAPRYIIRPSSGEVLSNS